MKFTEVLDDLGIRYITEGHRHVRPGWVGLDCPWCGRDTEGWHLGYSLENHYTKCWRCGFHSTVNVIMEYTGYSFKQCANILKDVETDYIPKKVKTKGKLILPKGIGDLQPAHVKYITRRGFDIKEIKSLWQIQGIGLSSQLPWRIFIPIIYHGKMVSWTTRSISKNKKITRYISAAELEELIPHKDILYGEDFARDVIIIVEGPTDVWKIGPGAVATLGLNYSTEQLTKMVQYRKRIICFDSDKLAQVRANKLADELSPFTGETYNIQLDSEDAGAASKKEIRQIRKMLLS